MKLNKRGFGWLAFVLAVGVLVVVTFGWLLGFVEGECSRLWPLIWADEDATIQKTITTWVLTLIVYGMGVLCLGGVLTALLGLWEFLVGKFKED